MRAVTILAAAAAAAGFFTYQGWAQSGASGAVPAEFPPAAYSGRQYVDSKGCAFIRAGVDGNVTWVPRVDRARRQACGFEPTLAQAGQTSETTVASAAAPQPAPTVPQADAAPQPEPAAPQAAPAAYGATAGPAPAGGSRNAAQAPVVRAPSTAMQPVAPRYGAAYGGSSRSQDAGRFDTPRLPCSDARGTSREYLRSNHGTTLRCGPQAAPQVTYRRVISQRSARADVTTVKPYEHSAPDNAMGMSSTVRVVPAHVYRSQQVSTAGVYVPEGYKPVWDDDRLNPQRAHQTFRGQAQMAQVWTNTVPRVLIERD